MRRNILLFVFALSSAFPSLGQNVRFGPYEIPSVSNLYSPLLQANLPPNSPVLAVCHSPANATPCTNYATTYTGVGSACPNGAQDTPDPGASTSACQSTGDSLGNIGWWAPAGQYDYTICIGTTCLGPYTVNQGIASAGAAITVNGGSALTPPVNFEGGTNTTASNPSGANVQFNVADAASSILGVLKLNTDLGGSAAAPEVVNLSNVTNSSLANSGLLHPSITVTAGTGLTGGGTVALGGSVTLNATATGGGNPTIDNCTPDETGNSFPAVTSLTNYFLASWQFVFSTTTYFNCTVYIPTGQTGATVVVDVWSSDSTAGHTALITYADGVINSGTMNTGSLTAAANQTFTTTSTANNRVTKTFNVQSTLSNGSILVIQIGTAPTGTAPTANINVYPHFVL